MVASQYYRGFAVSVAWTLVLLTLGSVVHATESSLACPDWPTCFGTMMPLMEGGIFWEHLHRLVAGGLILIFAAATFIAWRDGAEKRSVVRAALAGVALLLVQAVFGGLTVIYQLPDAVSTTHLTLAFSFLSLAVVLATVTSPRRTAHGPLGADVRAILRRWGLLASGLVGLQSIIGAWVRHSDSGMACPDFPTCLGSWVPPLDNHFVAVQFTHRVMGVVAALAVLTLMAKLLRSTAAPHVRRAALGAGALVLTQFTLGVVSVFTILAVVPVSLHTLGAAALLSVLVLLTTWGFMGSATSATADMGSSPHESARAPLPLRSSY